MFVYIIQYTNWLYFILGILFYISSVYGLFYQYTVVKFEFFINTFVNVISMFTAICLCNQYDLLLGCTTYLESCNTNFVYMVCYATVFIIIELNPKIG